jgi:hypothetical protein
MISNSVSYVLPAGAPAGTGGFVAAVGCPVGSKVLGGGGQISNALNSGRVQLTYSAPNPPPAAPNTPTPLPIGPLGGWQAQGTNNVALLSGDIVTVVAYAVCTSP